MEQCKTVHVNSRSMECVRSVNLFPLTILEHCYSMSNGAISSQCHTVPPPQKKKKGKKEEKDKESFEI